MDKENEQTNIPRRRILQTSAAVGLVGIGPTAVNADEDELSSNGEGVVIQNTRSRVDEQIQQLGTLGNETSAVLIKDCNPWGVPANEEVLSDSNVQFEIINSDSLAEYDIGTHDVAIIPSTQDSTYYENLAENSSVLEQFVENGGVLVGRVTDDGYPCTTVWTEPFLPGDTNREPTFIDDVEVVTGRESPILDELDTASLSNWNYSTHGFFTDIPDSADVLVGTGSGGRDEPTYIEYEVGDGRVLATTHTMEWPYSQDSSGTRTFLQNELEYAIEVAEGSEGEDEVQLEPLIDDKIALAGEIDDVGATLNEQPQVSGTLSDLERDVDDGEISADRAAEAIQRKQVGESITRSYIGGLSPRDTSEFDTGGEITSLAITAGTQGLLGVASIGRITKYVGWGRLGSRLGSAKDRLKRGIDKVVDTLVGASSQVSRFVRNRTDEAETFLRELIIDGGITTGATLADELASRVDAVREEGGDLVLQFYEQLIPGRTVSDDLEKLDQTLGPANGGPTFEGTTENARSAEETAVADIEATLEDTERRISQIETGLAVTSFLGVAASALVVSGFGSVAGLTLSLIELVLGVAAALLGVAVGLDGIRRAHRTHNDAIDAVIDGRPEV